jgi:dihydroorotase
MIQINNTLTLSGEKRSLSIESEQDKVIAADNLTIFPGLIDPHVHFRTPGLEHKEDWRTAAKAAIRGGYTTVFDMPNTLPPTITSELLREKIALIHSQLNDVGIPLRYQLYFGADKHHMSEIHKVKRDVIGIKIFMGCSTGNMVVDDDESLHAIFAIAANQNMLVAVHAEDETRICERKSQFKNASHYHDHSVIRDVETATLAVEKAISLSRIYGTRLYILHVSSIDEVRLIKQAKAEGLPVFAETTPHHLFLNDQAYDHLNGFAVVNPPLRSSNHQAHLFAAIRDGIIDTIGSDHAPHLPAEKSQPYGQCPSGMPGIETTLPLLITAHHEGLITLEQILSLTCTRPREIFHIPENDDVVLVDINSTRQVKGSDLSTKCGWSAFEGRPLRGWPKHIVVKGHYFDLTPGA